MHFGKCHFLYLAKLQFYLKNDCKTRVFIFERMAHNTYKQCKRVICVRLKNFVACGDTKIAVKQWAFYWSATFAIITFFPVQISLFRGPWRI